MDTRGAAVIAAMIQTVWFNITTESGTFSAAFAYDPLTCFYFGISDPIRTGRLLFSSRKPCRNFPIS